MERPPIERWHEDFSNAGAPPTRGDELTVKNTLRLLDWIKKLEAEKAQPKAETYVCECCGKDSPADKRYDICYDCFIESTQ